MFYGWLSSGRLALFGLALVAISLAVIAFSGAVLSYNSAQATGISTAQNDAFQSARYWVGAEESLERKYWREPSAEVNGLFEKAAAELVSSLVKARSLGANPVQINEMLRMHGTYLDSIRELFAAIDRKDLIHAADIDAGKTDPTFDALQTLVVAAAEVHKIEATSILTSLLEIQRLLLIGATIIFLPGLIFVILLGAALNRFHRHTMTAAAREEGVIRASELRFRALIQNATDVIIICKSSCEITYLSPTASTSWGYDSQQPQLNRFDQLVHVDDVAAFRIVWETRSDWRSAGASAELRIRTAGGEWKQCEVIFSNLVAVLGHEGFVITARDISERKEFESQLLKQAFNDALTGLPNRLLLRDRLDQALARAPRQKTRVGLIFLDLDNFKQINDSLGHHIGDKLLIEVSERLGRVMQRNSTVARLGGDEFIVLLDRVSGKDEVIGMADRIKQAIDNPFILDGRSVIVGASMGIALSDCAHETADTLIRNADAAMYRAKGGGRGRHVVFEPEMHTCNLERLEMESALRHAISSNQLVVYYQPIVVLEGERVAEVEALVRWQHPTLGLVAPIKFIPLAEDTGLIVPLGLWVLEEACRQVVAWHEESPATPMLTVSVNLSPRQFQQSDLVSEIEKVLGRTGMPATSLKLEITESTIMKDVENTISTLWELKKLGIQLAIDDFGMGYSSLSYLKRLPLDVLKIDKSFVDGIENDVEGTAIIRAIVTMAKSLNLKITAEGVENATQSAFLRSLSCDHAQGYYFARPVPSASVLDLLENINSRHGETQAA